MLRSLSFIGGKEPAEKKKSDNSKPARQPVGVQKKHAAKKRPDNPQEVLMKEYLSLYRQGPLPVTTNAYIQYVITLVGLFRKLWEGHLEWATSHIVNHIAIEMAMGEVLFAKESEEDGDDKHAINAAAVLEHALNVARYRYVSCKRDVSQAERELKDYLKGGRDQANEAISRSSGNDRDGGSKTDMTSVISRSLNSVSMAVYDQLYAATMELSVQPRKDRSRLRPSQRQEEEEREMMENFGDVWIACEEPLLSALELLWPAAGVEIETEVTDPMLMSAIFGVATPGSPSVGHSSSSSSSFDGTEYGSDEEGGGSDSKRMRSSLLYGLVRGQCLQALMRSVDKLQHPRVDLTPAHTPSHTPRGIVTAAARKAARLEAPLLSWTAYHATLDIVHSLVSPEQIQLASQLADSAMYAARLVSVEEERDEHTLTRMDSADYESTTGGDNHNQNYPRIKPSERESAEAEMGQSQQWVTLIELLWDLRGEVPRPLPTLPSVLQGSSMQSALAPFTGAEETKGSPRLGVSLRGGYATANTATAKAVFVDDVGSKSPGGVPHSPRTVKNTTVWASSKKTLGNRKGQMEAAAALSQAYLDATREQIEFYELERQQELERENALRAMQLQKDKDAYDRRQARLTLERTAARASLNFVDSVYVEAMMGAMESRGVRFRSQSAASTGSGVNSSGGNGEEKGADGNAKMPFRGPPQAWTQRQGGGAAEQAASPGRSMTVAASLGLGGGDSNNTATTAAQNIQQHRSQLAAEAWPSSETAAWGEASQHGAGLSVAGSTTSTHMPASMPFGGPSAQGSMEALAPRRDLDDTGDDRSSGSNGGKVENMRQKNRSMAIVAKGGRLDDDDDDDEEEGDEHGDGPAFPPSDPTNIAEHGRLAYLPDDSGLSQDFNVSHGTQYYDPFGQDVLRAAHPEDRDARSIVGSGEFAHHRDPHTRMEGPTLAEDSLEEYPYNTTQLHSEHPHQHFQHAQGDTDPALHTVGRNAFLDIDSTGGSVATGLSHPYRRHLIGNNSHQYASSHANIVGGSLELGSQSLVTMGDGDAIGAGAATQHQQQQQPDGSSSMPWGVYDVTAAVSAEISAVSKVFPAVAAGSSDGVPGFAADAHWSLSLRSLPANTEKRTFTTSQGITLSYAPLDSRPELRQLEWHLRPNQLPPLLGDHDADVDANGGAAALTLATSDGPAPGEQDGKKSAYFAHGGSVRGGKGSTLAISGPDAGVDGKDSSTLAPGNNGDGVNISSLVESSIATNEEGGFSFANLAKSDLPGMQIDHGQYWSPLEIVADETMLTYLNPAAVTDDHALAVGLHGREKGQGGGANQTTNRIERMVRPDDDATIDHMVISNEEYDNRASYLPFDVDPADDESLVSADLLTVSTFYSDAPHNTAAKAQRIQRERAVSRRNGFDVDEDDDWDDDNSAADFESYKFFDPTLRPVDTALLTTDNVRSHSAQVHRYDHDNLDNVSVGSEKQGTRFNASAAESSLDDGALGLENRPILPGVTEEGVPGNDDTGASELYQTTKSRSKRIVRAPGRSHIVYKFVPAPILTRPSPVVLAPALLKELEPGLICGHLQRHTLLAARVVGADALPSPAAPYMPATALLEHPLFRHELRVGRTQNPSFRLRARGTHWKAIDGRILFGKHSLRSAGVGQYVEKCDSGSEAKQADMDVPKPQSISRIVPVLEWARPHDAVYPTQLTVAYPDSNQSDGIPTGEANADGSEEGKKGNSEGKDDNGAPTSARVHLCARAYDPSAKKIPSRKPLKGSYLYNPPAGTILGVGHHSLSVTFVPYEWEKFQSHEYKAFTSIYISKGTPVLDYISIDKEDVMIAGTPLENKYFECEVKEGDLRAVRDMNKGIPVCKGPDGPWVGMQLPTCEHQRLHLRYLKGVESIKKQVLRADHDHRRAQAEGRRAVREYQDEISRGTTKDVGLVFDEDDGNDDKDDEGGEGEDESASPSGPQGPPDLDAMEKALRAQLKEEIRTERETMEMGEYLFSYKRGDVLERGSHRLWCQYRPSAFLNKHYTFGYASIPFEVGARAPRMEWRGVLDIEYLTPISQRQLKATVVEEPPLSPVLNSPATLPPNHPGKGWGVVRYDKANEIGVILEAGKHTLWAYFEPFDPLLFRKRKISIEINVLQVETKLEWPMPTPIYDGWPVSAAQLNARAVVPDSADPRQGGGTFTYDIEIGKVLPLGEHPCTVTFVPDFTHRYSTVTLTTTLRVWSPKTPVLFWPDLEDMRYPAELSRIELSVRCSSLNCTGKFMYDPPLNTVLNAGKHTLTCRFVPDLPSWCEAVITTEIIIAKARPRLRWSEPSSIIFGSAIKDYMLCAYAVNEGLPKENCQFTYNPPVNSVLGMGTHIITATFEAINEDAVNYESGEIATNLTVRARPKKRTSIQWAARVPELRHPEKLTTGDHLTAVCNEAKGMFVFTPNPGTCLNVGTHELKCKFYPENVDWYMASEAKSKITVTKGEATLKYELAHEDCFFEYGRPLDRRILSAHCTSQIGSSVPGNYEYFLNGKPLDGPDQSDEARRLDSGSHRITCVFTPSALANFDAPEPKSVDIFVERVKPTLQWEKPMTGIYPAILSPEHLCCMTTTELCTGTFKYSHKPTTVLEPDDDEEEAQEGRNSADVDSDTGAKDKKDTKSDDVKSTRKAEKVGFLPAGKHHLKCRFTPDDLVNFYGGDKSTVWEIEKGEIPLLHWKMKNNKLVYGEGLDAATHFTCQADHPHAHYEYYPPAGTKLPVGTYKVRCTITITGEEANCYNPLVVKGPVEVIPQTPVLEFPGASDVILHYGEPLELGKHLNAKLQTQGYAPSDISMLGIRDRKQEESDREERERGMTKVQIKESRLVAQKEEQELEAAKNKIIEMAMEVADHEENADSTTDGNSTAASTRSSLARQKEHFRKNLPRGYIYNPRPGTILPAGTHKVTCHFEPPDESVNIGKSAILSTMVVVKTSKPTLEWKAPASLKYGMPLTKTELSARVSGPLKAVLGKGAFTYAPPLGTVLPVGEHKLTVTFQPSKVDSVERVQRRVAVNVFKTWPPVFRWPGVPMEVPKGYRMTADDLNAECLGVDGEQLEGKFVYTPSFGNVIGAVGKREVRCEFILKGKSNELYFKPKPIIVEVTVTK